MTYDGSINISTKIDEKGFNKGTKSLTSSLSGVLRSVRNFGRAMITAFGFAAIFRFISGIVSSFNIMSSSIGSNVASLSSSLQALKGAFTSLILTALAPIIPYLIQFANWLARILSFISAFIAALFGIKVVGAQAGASLGDAAGGQAKLAKETKKANKELKGQLAAFDQLNVLDFDQTEAPQTPDAGAGGGGGGLPLLPSLDGLPDITDKVQAFKEKFLQFIQPVIDALGRLYDALVPLGQTIWEGLKWAWDNILVPIAEWTVTDLIPAFLDILAAAARVLNEALIALAPYAKDFFDNFLAPLGRFVGDAIIAFLKHLAAQLNKLAVWIRENPEKFANFVKVLGVLAVVIGVVVAALFLFLNPAYLVVAAIVALIAIILNWGAVWEWIKLVAREVWKDILTGLSNLGLSMAEKLRTIREGFTEQLAKIRQGWVDTFIGIASFVKAQINTIIGYINSMIGNIVGGINGVINALNTVGGIVPGFKAVATVSAPQIPHLATGAVVPAHSNLLAMIGEGNKREIVAPEDMIRRIVREESGGSGKQEVVIRFEGTLSALVRELKPIIDKENTRSGASLIVGAS
jgi:hypothetical protein